MDVVQELNEPYHVTEEQKQFYRENGFIRLKNVFSASFLDHYSPRVEAAVNASGDAPLDEQALKDAEDAAYARAFKQVINIWKTDPEVRELAFSKRLARIAAELMGVDGVRMYHDQALFKNPGGDNATPFHADQFYWPLSSEKTVTAWVPFEAVPEAAGPLEFVAGSHNADLGRAIGIGSSSETAIGDAVAAGGFPLIGGAFEKGEVSFHAGWTFHRAPSNTSDNTRKVFTVIYMDKEMRMVEPANDNQRADAARYMPDTKVGGACCGNLNPVLWEKDTNETTTA